MRFCRSLLAFTAVSALAIAGTAQGQEGQGIQDLQGTINALQDEAVESEEALPPATETSAEPEPTPDAAPEADTQPPAEGPLAEPSEPAESPPASAEPSPPADEPSAPAPPLTEAELAQVERAAERGRLLVAIARAGMVATQDMLARVADPEGAGISGWVAEPQGNGMLVTFYADGEDAPHAVYRASVLGGRVTSRNVYPAESRPPLTSIQARMAAARAATDGLPNRACSDQPFYVLVVPPATADATVDVYQTTAPSERTRVPLGGHFRSTVAADGSVAETRGFTSACVDIEVPPQVEGQPPRPIGVTHLLDPMPTEVHVLVAALTGRPLLVATGEPQRIWLVTGDRIAEVRP